MSTPLVIFIVIFAVGLAGVAMGIVVGVIASRAQRRRIVAFIRRGAAQAKNNPDWTAAQYLEAVASDVEVSLERDTDQIGSKVRP